ncbi:MAG: hypothetical protein E7388_08090 [Ruminococcaceae bacterium]|nr:hypothetical protein [Oscillospiraceae bacterium]
MRKEKYTDYRKYRLNKKELLLYGSVFVIGAVLVIELMFDIWWLGVVLGLVLLPLFYKKLSAYLRDRRINSLEEEFCRFMQLTVAALAGGTTFENVFREVADSVSSEESIMKKEYYIIDRMICLNYDSRDAFSAFAVRSGSEDIKKIAAALACTSEVGGNVIRLLQSGVGALRLKQDTEMEIKRILSAPKMNHRIMSVMPFAFVFILKTMSPEYIKSLYSWPGRGIMVAVAVLIAGSWLLGEKIGKTRF